MTGLSQLVHRDRDERGVALVTVMLVVLVISAFTATVAAVSIDNRKNANSDRLSGSALSAADAGVAQAIVYLHGNGVAAITCPESAGPSFASCTSQPAGWSSPSSPQQVALSTNGCSISFKNCAQVFITAVQAFNPPLVKAGTYAIHSLGFYGQSPGARDLVVNVQVKPDTFPVGVFGATVTANGNTGVQTESLFTQGCVSPLSPGGGNGLVFAGIDAYWGQPSAAHSTVGLSTSNNNACTTNDNGRIPPGPGSPSTSALDANCPDGSVVNPTNQSIGSTANGIDLFQSASGGLVSSGNGQGKDCWHLYQRPDGSWYPDGTCPTGYTGSTESNGLCDTTSFTLADLQRYGYRPRGLSDSQYAALKARAQAGGTYNPAESSINAALAAAQAAGTSDPVLYWDCSTGSVCPGGSPTVKTSDFPSSFTQGPPSGNTCPASLPIVTVVVVHGSLVISGGNSSTPWLDAAVFVPDGTYGGNGGANIYGTMFSNTLSLGGNQDFKLDNCWVQDFPGATLTVTQTSFRESDTADLQQ